MIFSPKNASAPQSNGLPLQGQAVFSELGERLLQRHFRIERGVFAGVADADDELAGIDGPLVSGFIPVAEGAGVQVEGDVSGFAGSETDLFKALEFALRAD